MDARPPHWDMGRHLYTSLRYRELLTGLHLKTFLLGYFYYPPLYYWVSIPVFGIFGFSLSSAVFTNLFFMLILSLSTFFATKKLFNQNWGMLASIMILTLPMLSGQFKEFQLDAPLSAIAALVLALTIYNPNFSNRKLSIWLGLSVGFGMLLKWTFIAFSGPLLIYQIVITIKNKSRNWSNLLLSIITTAIISAPWYLHNFRQLGHDIKMGGIGSAVAEGDPTGFAWMAFTWYFKTFFELHLWFLGTALAAISIIFVLYKKDLRSRLSPYLISGAFGYLAFFVFANKDARYIMPILPAIVMIEIGFLSSLSYSWRKLLIPLIIIFSLFTFSETSFGWPVNKSVGFNIENYHTNLFTAGSYTVSPPDPAPWFYDDIVAKAKSDGGEGKSIQFLGSDTMNFNRWDVAYLAQANGLIWPGENLEQIDYDYLVYRQSGAAKLADEVSKLQQSGYNSEVIGNWSLPDKSDVFLLKIKK